MRAVGPLRMVSPFHTSVGENAFVEELLDAESDLADKEASGIFAMLQSKRTRMFVSFTFFYFNCFDLKKSIC